MFYFACLVFAIFGAIIGSFSVAQVWRIRSAELRDAKKNGEKINTKEWAKLKHLTESKVASDRSHCLYCGYQLRWFDLVPILSWISLRGRCRKCRKPIGWTEFLAEIIVGIIFGVVFSNFYTEIFVNPVVAFLKIITLFVAFSSLTVLFIYDAKWSLLPTKVLWILIFSAAIFFVTGLIEKGINVTSVLNLSGSIVIFPFLYFVLSKISGGAWVGDGDWLLGLGLVFLLPNSPFFAILLLLFSNLIGLVMIFVAALLEKKKIQKGAQIPFGPAMILACLILMIFSNFFGEFAKFLS